MDALLSDANETLVSAAGKKGVLEAISAKADLILSTLPQPGMLAKYGPMAGLGLAGLTLAGALSLNQCPSPTISLAA